MTQTKFDGHNRDVGNDWQFNLKTSLLLHFCPKCKDQKEQRLWLHSSYRGGAWLNVCIDLISLCLCVKFDIQINVYIHFDYDELK